MSGCVHLGAQRKMAAEHEFVAPVRKIKVQEDFTRWMDSEVRVGEKRYLVVLYIF